MEYCGLWYEISVNITNCLNLQDNITFLRGYVGIFSDRSVIYPTNTVNISTKSVQNTLYYAIVLTIVWLGRGPHCSKHQTNRFLIALKLKLNSCILLDLFEHCSYWRFGNYITLVSCRIVEWLIEYAKCAKTYTCLINTTKSGGSNHETKKLVFSDDDLFICI